MAEKWRTEVTDIGHVIDAIGYVEGVEGERAHRSLFSLGVVEMEIVRPSQIEIGITRPFQVVARDTGRTRIHEPRVIEILSGGQGVRFPRGKRQADPQVEPLIGVESAQQIKAVPLV